MISGVHAMVEKETEHRAGQNGLINSLFEPGQSDLFATIYKRLCARCAAPFDAPIRRGNGRPRIFCSDACRVQQAKQQRREWHLSHRSKATA